MISMNIETINNDYIIAHQIYRQMIKYYYPDVNYNNHDTMINNVIFNSDYDCLRCNKTNPITQHVCIKCGHKNPEIYYILGRFDNIDKKIKILIKKEINVSTITGLSSIILRLIHVYPDISQRAFQYILENYDEIIDQLDYLLLELV